MKTSLTETIRNIITKFTSKIVSIAHTIKSWFTSESDDTNETCSSSSSVDDETEFQEEEFEDIPNPFTAQPTEMKFWFKGFGIHYDNYDPSKGLNEFTIDDNGDVKDNCIIKLAMHSAAANGKIYRKNVKPNDNYRYALFYYKYEDLLAFFKEHVNEETGEIELLPQNDTSEIFNAEWISRPAQMCIGTWEEVGRKFVEINNVFYVIIELHPDGTYEFASVSSRGNTYDIETDF